MDKPKVLYGGNYFEYKTKPQTETPKRTAGITVNKTPFGKATVQTSVKNLAKGFETKRKVGIL